MLITVLSTIIIMIAYFLVLYAAVGFIQDKRLFSSAPEEILAVIPSSKKERFFAAHIIGWLMMAVAILMFIGAFALGICNGIQNNYGFLKFFARFLIMLYCMEIYDIVFFDWFLLCHSGFYPHFYPETKEIVGAGLFGFNKKTHILHFLIYIPVCAVLALICTLF